jgi:hypothetical protein
VGQQIGAIARELAQLYHRGGVLVLGQLTPASVMLRSTVQLCDEHPVSPRADIDHAF